MVYEVTKADYLAYSGTTEDSLPDNFNILLKIANSMVGTSVKYNYKDGNTSHTDAVKNAVSFQVLYWIANETSPFEQQESSYSFGNISVNNNPQNNGTLCQQSVDYLNKECLLYRGVIS